MRHAPLLVTFVVGTALIALFFIPHHARSGQLGRTHIQAFRRQP